MHPLIKHTVKQGLQFAKAHRWYVAGAAGLTLLFTRKQPVDVPLKYISNAIRDQWYGPLRYISAPIPSNPESVIITNDFAKNIISQTFPIIGYIQIHREAARSLQAALAEIERKGWTKKIKQFNGSWVPRYVRQSQTSLSSHSYGTSIDINADENPRDSPPTEDQALLAPIFEKHGWYWGDRFTRRDPMHFEYVLPPKGIV